MEQSITCCEVFSKIRQNFGWFKYSGDNKKSIYCMPYLLGSDGSKFRINNCPSCGAEVRSIELKEV